MSFKWETDEEVEPLGMHAIYFGQVSFSILVPGDVEILLPRESIPIRVTGDTLLGFKLIFECRSVYAKSDDRFPHKITAVPVDSQVERLPGRLLNVQHHISHTPIQPWPIIWFAAPH